MGQQPPNTCGRLNQLKQRASGTPTVEAFNQLGASYAKSKQFACAIAAFREALKLDPASARTHYNLAIALETEPRPPGSGDSAQAEAEFRSALATEPKFPEALQGLGDLLINQNRFSAAISYLEQAAAVDPSNPDHQISLALALESSGDTRAAIAQLEKTIAEHPNSSAAQFNLATFRARERQFTEAAEGFRKVLALDPNNDTARLSLAKALIGLERQPDALPYLNQVL
ncbi:MAG: tetratricopeptide repeat protein, partial [Bryobacteraceae bacterium]